jgi:hypothetical protein
VDEYEAPAKDGRGFFSFDGARLQGCLMQAGRLCHQLRIPIAEAAGFSFVFAEESARAARVG